MPAPFDQMTELSPSLELSGADGKVLDISGLDHVKVRTQLNAADELEVKLSAQFLDGRWRSDMPQWITGATVYVEAGYNGKLAGIQAFEVVSTTNDYSDDGGECVTIRGVSDLARAARNKDHRTFTGDDASIIDQICREYGWSNGVTADLTFGSTVRMKENGKSDLELLKRIARDNIIGGPRLNGQNILTMPEPSVGEFHYARGPSKFSDARRLHSLQVNREAGSFTTRVAVIGWDPVAEEYVEKDYEADEFGGDPKVVYKGKPATKELEKEATTQGLVLALIDYKGENKAERVDVLSSGRFMTEADADALAKKWFILREKLSRWSNITVDGNISLVPYSSIEIDGNMATMDKGIWLPTVVEHIFDAKGWRCELRSVRVVNEPIITPVDGTAIPSLKQKTS